VPRAIDDSKRLGTTEPTVSLANRRVTVTVHRQSHKQPRRRPRTRYLVGAAVAAVLVAAASFLIQPLLRSGTCGGPFSTMTHTDTGECVGVIDDNSVLDAALRPVADKIRTENNDVARTDRYAKIVLLTPLSAPLTSASPMGLDQIRHSLEGAYTALYRINHTPEFGDPSAMKMQMLMANFGSRQEYRNSLLTDILARSEPAHPVVAVVGLGESATGIKATAQALAGKGIPMVSAVASADSLNIQKFAGLRSVSPSDRDYVQALAQFLDKSGLRNGIIVADEANQNDDLYVGSLRAAYENILGGYLKSPAQSFRGGTVGNPATSEVFSPVVTNICNAVDSGEGLGMIFYAGRSADFDGFAQALRTRICPRPLVVLTAVTGFQVSQELTDALRSKNVTLVYTAATDSDWINDTTNRPEGFARFLEIARRELGTVSLTDGFAIQYYDAVVCAARALRLATEASGSPGSVDSPKSNDVRVQFSNLNFLNMVKAASGTLTFNSRADGRASGKTVIIRQIGSPNGQLPAKLSVPVDLQPQSTGY
jgi:ABC-type branched-subunit amino acid transport system substrate-binding protein